LNHFRILEMIFITGPLDDDEEINDVNLFLKGSHQILNEKEKHVVELLKQQIIYDIAVELSTICDGIGGNSSLKDEEAILEENEDNPSVLLNYNEESEQTNLDHTMIALLNNETDPEQTKLEENINCSDINPNCRDVNPNCTDVIQDINDSDTDSNINCNDYVEGTNFNGFNTDAGVENEIIFYMFPVKQDTPLGEWMMGISQSILPNRRIAKMQQQSMDLLHRIGDATIVDFADPRSSEKSEHLDAKIYNCVLKENDIENEESSLKEKTSLDSINDVASPLKIKTSLGSINDIELSLPKKESLSSINNVTDSQDSFPDNPISTNIVPIRYDNST
ncbi:2587_t:CDS:2, partial [Dentiscutata erythropus]